MKNLFLLTLTAAMLLAGCSNETESAGSAAAADTENVQPIGFSRTKIQFADRAELDRTLAEVAMMTREEKQAWEASHEGFVSMNTAARMVVGQMQTLGGKAEILALRNAYSDLFLFDPSREHINITPYYRSNRIGYDFVCNAYGEVEVAGETVNMNDLDAYAQTWVAQALAESAQTTRDARTVNSITLVSDVPYHQLIAASSCNIVNNRAQVFIRFSGVQIVNDKWSFPAECSYTVAYMQGITNNSVITDFDTRFDFYKLTSEGDSFTHTTPAPDYMVDEFVGWTNTVYNTGYKIIAGRKSEGVLFVQNY